MNWKELWAKLGVKRDKVISLFIATVLTLIFFLDAHFWNGVISRAMPLVDLFLFALILGLIAFIAGIIVIRSLVKVAAGLSLLIFLAQAYCSSNVIRTDAGTNALQLLIMVGLVYIAYDFLYSVWEDIKKYKEKLGKEGWDWRPKFFYYASIFFVLVFLIGIYDVMRPIILGFCIYH